MKIPRKMFAKHNVIDISFDSKLLEKSNHFKTFLIILFDQKHELILRKLYLKVKGHSHCQSSVSIKEYLPVQ